MISDIIQYFSTWVLEDYIRWFVALPVGIFVFILMLGLLPNSNNRIEQLESDEAFFRSLIRKKKGL